MPQRLLNQREKKMTRGKGYPIPKSEIPSRNLLHRLYTQEQRSTTQIAAAFGVSKGTIHNWLKLREIPIRSVGEGVSLAQTGKKHTQEHRMAISKGSKGKVCNHMVGRLNPSLASIGHQNLDGTKKSYAQGRRGDLGGMYFRSSWEANVARYLNFMVKKGRIGKWEYEPDTFIFDAIKRGTRSYTPDFKIWQPNCEEFDCYWEIKGYMDSKSAVKLKRMKIYYPEVKIVLLDKSWYQGFALRWKNIIPNWENPRGKF